MLTITKEVSFDCAHVLPWHEGQCKNIHGHTYKLQVTVAKKEKDLSAWVMDYGQLKQIINDKIVSAYDHALLLGGGELHHALLQLCQQFNLKHHYVPDNTTTEFIIEDIVNLLQVAFFTANLQNIKLVKVRLYESATSYAEWTEED